MVVSSPKVPKVITPQMYQTVMEELDTVTAQLKKTRETLWQTQDEVKDGEAKVKGLENHIEELVKTFEERDNEIKKLRAENSTHVEEEAKVRESLELMKKVFTRNQLKAREDQETLMLLQEERDLLLEENKHLRNSKEFNKNSKNEKDALIQRIKRESVEKERHLSSILNKVRAELESTKDKYAITQDTVRKLERKLASTSDHDDTKHVLEEQRQKINLLEYEIQQLHDQDDDILRQHVELTDGSPSLFDHLPGFCGSLSVLSK